MACTIRTKSSKLLWFCAPYTQLRPRKGTKAHFGDLCAALFTEPIIAFLEVIECRLNFLQGAPVPLQSRYGQIFCDIAGSFGADVIRLLFYVDVKAMFLKA